MGETVVSERKNVLAARCEEVRVRFCGDKILSLSTCSKMLAGHTGAASATTERRHLDRLDQLVAGVPKDVGRTHGGCVPLRRDTSTSLLGVAHQINTLDESLFLNVASVSQVI